MLLHSEQSKLCGVLVILSAIVLSYGLLVQVIMLTSSSIEHTVTQSSIISLLSLNMTKYCLKGITSSTSLDADIFAKMGLLLKERICP